MGYEIAIQNGGDEYEVDYCQDYRKLSHNIFLSDEDYIMLRHPSMKSQVSWFRMIYGNDGFDVICDYTANDVCETIYKAVESLIDKYERLSVGR
jgi:hypothetical protein